VQIQDPVIYSRLLTASTLSFHIIFATIGVGVPVLIALAEWAGIRRKDEHYLLMARRWSRGFAVSVAIGVVTGTTIGFQLNLLWPKFMSTAGQAFALPTFLETYAFFVEAVFFVIYLSTWDRFKHRITHFLLIIPVVIGSSASAVFITSVNAFMNHPAGIELSGGMVKNAHPLLPLFSPATPTKISHVLASSYVTSAFAMAAIPAFALLQRRRHPYYKKALKLTMTTALVFILVTIAIGDLSGKYLAKYQPEKLAAAEWHFKTKDKAPLIVGGILTKDNEIRFGIKIPYALSILAGGSPHAEVKGLNETPQEDRPPLFVHYLFNAKIGMGFALAFVSALYVWNRWRKRDITQSRFLLWSIVWCAPLAILTMEISWIFAEIALRPWILRGFMKVDEGVTQSGNVAWMLAVFSCLYAAMSAGAAYILVKMYKHNTAEEEMKRRGIG
jgi:cytochrome d ubiquinol oxidase subunit I